jgi:hypothetical protein
VRGGMFLLSQADPADVFTPDDFSEEQRMIQQSTADFVERELIPRMADLEAQKPGVNREMMKKAADIGLLSLEIPEAYEGLGMDKACAMIVQEELGRYESFGVTYSGHNGIGMQPIYSFGTEMLKRKYLPPLGSGTLVSAYALTEPGSGSDALGARTKATLVDDGQAYLLNGSKMWITNAGFCDIFIAFAKVDGDKFTCFIVDRHAPGVTVGEEEKKMGLKGSSTRGLSFDNVKVPADHVIGEVGKGHKIAFNALNLGRFKLGAAAVGSGVWALREAVQYAKERQQFGQPIARFGAIQHKLAQMLVRLWVLRAMTTRTAGLLDRALARVDRNDMTAVMAAIENYSVECSILKVHGTEALQFVADEEVQVFGGYGFSAEYPAERRYRDCRVNRIFEGTNEINRLIITSRFLKKAAEGEVALLPALEDATRTVGAGAAPAPAEGLDALQAVVDRGRRLVLFALGHAWQKHGKALAQEQELLALLSDMSITLYATESAWMRAVRKAQDRKSDASRGLDIATVFANDAVNAWSDLARQVLASTLSGEALTRACQQAATWLAFPPVDTVSIRRRLADGLLNADRIEV